MNSDLTMDEKNHKIDQILNDTSIWTKRVQLAPPESTLEPRNEHG